MDETMMEAWARWLEEQGYAASTRRQYMKDARQVLEGRGTPRCRHAARVLETWARTTAQPIPPEVFAPYQGPPPRRQGPRVRTREARSIHPDAWERLARAVVEDEHPAARVLEIQILTGWRVGDVLRLPLAEVRRGAAEGEVFLPLKGGHVAQRYVSGLTQIAFRRLATVTASFSAAGTVDDWIRSFPSRGGRPPAPGATPTRAYDRVRYRLRQLAEEAGVRGRVHTHRLRRTVAMQALSATRDVGAVSQLLGHRNQATTLRYLDEERPEAVVDVEQSLHKRFLSGLGGPEER